MWLLVLVKNRASLEVARVCGGSCEGNTPEFTDQETVAMLIDNPEWGSISFKPNAWSLEDNGQEYIYSMISQKKIKTFYPKEPSP